MSAQSAVREAAPCRHLEERIFRARPGAFDSYGHHVAGTPGRRTDVRAQKVSHAASCNNSTVAFGDKRVGALPLEPLAVGVGQIVRKAVRAIELIDFQALLQVGRLISAE